MIAIVCVSCKKEGELPAGEVECQDLQAANHQKLHFCFASALLQNIQKLTLGARDNVLKDYFVRVFFDCLLCCRYNRKRDFDGFNARATTSNSIPKPCSSEISRRFAPTMRLPWSPQNPNQPLDLDEEARRKPVRWTDSLNKTDWKHFLEVRQLVPAVVGATTILFCVHLYKRYLRRIPSTEFIKPTFFRKRSLFGTVTSVGDGDNFRLFHTPGGRLAGWGWLPWRRVPDKREDLKDKTVMLTLELHFWRDANVKLAGSYSHCRR